MLAFFAVAPGARACALGLSTLAAYQSALLGGTSGSMRSQTFLAADSSIASLAASSIDRIGRTDIALFAPTVPPSLWTDLRTFGRMRTAVRAAPTATGADVALLLANDASMIGKSREIERIERAGVPLLTVYDVGAASHASARSAR
jgi:hypothetical protein